MDINPKAAAKYGIAPFDAAETIRDEEDIAAYLQGCEQECDGDPEAMRRAHETVDRACARMRAEQDGDS